MKISVKKISVDFSSICEARSRRWHAPRRLQRWAERLASERALPNYAVQDLLYDCAPLNDTAVIEQITGESPFTMYHHPLRAVEAFGFLHHWSTTVAYALVIMERLGLGVDAIKLTDPLRQRLRRKRDAPILTPYELSVLWATRDSSYLVVNYPGKAPLDYYAVSVVNGVAVGGANPDGEHFEVIGKLGERLHEKFLSAGGRLTWPQFKRLVEAA